MEPNDQVTVDFIGNVIDTALNMTGELTVARVVVGEPCSGCSPFWQWHRMSWGRSWANEQFFEGGESLAILDGEDEVGGGDELSLDLGRSLNDILRRFG